MPTTMCGGPWAEATKAMNEQAIAVLRAILAEVAGHEAPYSADSYLPPHLVHDMRQVIEQHERCHEQAVERQQLEAIGQVGKRLDCLLDETPELMP